MIRVTVFYPNRSGATFDVDYYRNKHIPLAEKLLGDAVKEIAVGNILSCKEMS